VAGVVYGSITNCAALNTSITRISGSDMRLGRTVSGSGTFTNNVAWVGMRTIGITFGAGTANNPNGLDITSAAISADGAIGGRFTQANGWTTQNGRLPGLRGNTVDMPEHLK
jgi:hypothetical protein